MLGEMQLQVLLRKHGGKSAAAGWDGDRYAVFEGPKDRLGLVWLSTWDSEEDAREFTAAYIRYQTSRVDDLPRPRRGTHDTIWRNAGDQFYVVQRRGLDVAVVEGFPAETTPTLLEAAFHAGKVEMKPDTPGVNSPQGGYCRESSMRIVQSRALPRGGPLEEGGEARLVRAVGQREPGGAARAGRRPRRLRGGSPSARM